MQEPSNGIHRDLLPHVHLVSTYRFPRVPALHPDKVSEWLLTAPRITRDQAPFYWTYLDRPEDGTILLIWQSPNYGSEFPSDGYVYPPMETAFELEVNGGYTLQMHQHKCGYAPGESVATHSRRRYRLLPSKYGNVPVPDPALWIVFYSQCDPNERVPSQHIPVDLRIQNMMQTRAYLTQQGQLVQKEFMLHDRANWPQITFPRGQQRPPMYNNSAPQTRVPPSMAYPPHNPQPGPPAKRARTQQTANQNVAGAVAVHDVDDEEDTQRGDFFDHTTPREVSMARYKQNHEWMEEILSSPYGIHQIIPADLSLGLRGELASLTEGTFDALSSKPDDDKPKNVYIGRLDPEKAEAFRKRANERIAETNKDIEKMKAKYAKRLAKFKKGSVLSAAEKELHTAVTDPSDVGPEYWRLEGRIDDEDSEDGKAVQTTPSKVEDILAQVEASLGRSAVAVQELRRIQDGGFEEAVPASPSPVPAPPSPKAPSSNSLPQSINGGGTPQSGVLITGADIDMDNSAAGLLDQYHTGLSSNATPASNFGNTPQPIIQSLSAAGTPGVHAASPQPLAHQSPQPAAPAPTQDVTMTEVSEQPAQTDTSGTGDWVVVPPGGVTPEPTAAPAPEAPELPLPVSIPESAPTVSTSISAPSEPIIAEPTAEHALSPPSEFDSAFPQLGDLDSTGDVMANYGDDSGDMGGLELDIEGMDDSAFGEAFHGVEHAADGDGDGEGNTGDGL